MTLPKSQWVTIRHLPSGQIIARKAWLAQAMLTRMRGMLGRSFGSFDAMIFPRCNAIHMWFMAQALDILFVDESWTITSSRHDLQPWKLARDGSSKHTIELPAGALSTLPFAAGDQLQIQPLDQD